MENNQIYLKKVTLHNLKDVDLTLTPGQLIVFTGVSGSGKSSIAFHTIYVEGQRRYIESLSHQVRRHFKDLKKPEAKSITGISPTIAIEQKLAAKTPRSTVGTITGIYDHLRILFARIGNPFCPISKEPLEAQSKEKIIHTIEQYPIGTKLIILAPFVRGKKGSFTEELKDILKRGFLRVKVDDEITELTGHDVLDEKTAHDIDIVIDRLIIEKDSLSRLSEAVTTALDIGKGVFSILEIEEKQETLFSLNAFSKKSNISYPPLDPSNFSFNHPKGMCPLCQGIGEVKEFDLDIVINPKLSISDDCCSIATSYQTIRYKNIYDNLARLYDFSIDTPWEDLPQKAKKVFLYGTTKKWLKMRFVHPIKNTTWTDYIGWKGVLHEAKNRFYEAKSDKYRQKMEAQMSQMVCPDCKGARIKSYPAAVKLGGKTLKEITSYTIDETKDFFENLKLNPVEKKIGKQLIQEIQKRLGYLTNVGLSYLSLDRTSPTLSGGESQRIRLASQIGSGLVSATYILDEPSIGLHSYDHEKLIATLLDLKAQNNTVIVVEHDEQTIMAADTIVDVGPYAGKNGGQILYQGSVSGLLKSEASLTGKYLSKRLSIPYPKKRRSLKKHLTIKNASLHNLDNLTVKIPLEGLVCVTGVSGSGKSTLINDVLYPALIQKKSPCTLVGEELIDKVIDVDQSPIGKTKRSNLATYVKLLDDIRALLASLPESKIRNYLPGHFSFNVKEGSCRYCKGLGKIQVDMDFMEDQEVLCNQCQGKRFDPEILSIRYKDKNIFDILQLDVDSLADLFCNIPNIKRKLDLIKEVGLGYMQIGQPSTTISGGEAQRIKLAKELIRPSTGKTLYILDEPTTGLHFHDISKLIIIFQKIIDLGNSIIIIEHNLDLIQIADHIIDLGPKAGKFGGRVIGQGTPEQIAKLDTPTGIVLKKHLKNAPYKPHPIPCKKTTKQSIIVEKAKEHNLKQVSLEIPSGSFTVFTGVSGSGKTSFAFDTLYAEGQRRYIESMPLYVRQFIKMMPKPKVEKISGLSPAIAIEQKNHGVNPRSTLGTLTEIYDLFRILFAHLGMAFCPDTGEEIKKINKQTVVDKLLSLPSKEKIIILAPIHFHKKESFEDLIKRLSRDGFLRIRLNNTYYELDENIPYEKAKKNELLLIIDRIIIQSDIEKRLYESVDKAAQISDGIILIDKGKEDLFFNLSFACEKTGKSYPPITTKTFSFNSEHGHCLECQGLGTTYGINLIDNPALDKFSLSKLYLHLIQEAESFDLFSTYFSKLGISVSQKIHKLTEEEKKIFFHGTEKKIKIKKGLFYTWKGIHKAYEIAAKLGSSLLKYQLRPLMEEKTCLTCKGSRLNPLARNVKIKGISITELCSFSLEKTYSFIDNLVTNKNIPPFLKDTCSQIQKNLSFLLEIGLGYLSLDRSSPTLSGGEMQRVRLAKQLGSGLTHCIYVLDEPTIGLHPHNSGLLIQALKKLQKHNTLVIIEHDPAIIEQAEFICDFGPLAGVKGGKIVAKGTLDQIKKDKNSLTGAYLSHKKTIPIPSTRRKSTSFIEIEKANANNLKNLNLKIPTQVISCITGVSGSGKSSLIKQILKPALHQYLFKKAGPTVTLDTAIVSNLDLFDKMIYIDQNPIGQSIRSDVSTYTDTLTHIRSFLASLPLAKAKGFQPRYFSYNHKKGMCKTCWGLGYKTVDLRFLPSVKTPCESCQGYRLNKSSLQVTYKEKHLGHILELTIDEACDFFDAIPKIKNKLNTLISVGLSYLKLGQDITTLSGGESQRIRLCKELSKRSTGKTLYLIDEPTIGLHPDDISKIIPIFHSLTDKKNTLVIIEHNLDIIANADHIIDLGPDAGEKGGDLICQGSPEEIIKHPTSVTGKFLKDRFVLNI